MPIQKPGIEVLYSKNKNLRKQDVEALHEWIKLQPHLPKVEEYVLIIFLHRCNFSIEAAKKRIDNYYTVKALSPEIFTCRSPRDGELQKTMEASVYTLLPKRSPEGYSIFYASLIDANPDTYNFLLNVKLFDMAVALHLQEVGTCPGYILIADSQGFALSHAMKMNLTIVKKYMYFAQKATPFKLRAVHCVNSVPYLDKIIGIFKPFMRKDLLDRLTIHQGNNKTIYKSVPKECLPEEVGGTLGPAIKIHNRYMERIKQNEKFYLEDEKLVADESKRQGKPRSESEMFGVEGSFRKLDID